jgi:hypothetical protein
MPDWVRGTRHESMYQMSLMGGGRRQARLPGAGGRAWRGVTARRCSRPRCSACWPPCSRAASAWVG